MWIIHTVPSQINPVFKRFSNRLRSPAAKGFSERIEVQIHWKTKANPIVTVCGQQKKIKCFFSL